MDAINAADVLKAKHSGYNFSSNIWNILFILRNTYTNIYVGSNIFIYLNIIYYLYNINRHHSFCKDVLVTFVVIKRLIQTIDSSEAGIYKRKILREKVRKHVFDQEKK